MCVWSGFDIRWECPFSPRQAHGFVPDGLGLVFFILPFTQASLVCSLHTSLQTLLIQVGKDETLTLTGCIKLFVVYMTPMFA